MFTIADLVTARRMIHEPLYVEIVTFIHIVHEYIGLYLGGNDS